MAVTIGGIVAGILTTLGYVNSLAGEAWTRYFILLAGLSIDNVVGEFTGLYALETILGFVIANVFGVAGFFFPIYYGVSSLLILAVIMPLVFFLIRMATR